MLTLSLLARSYVLHHFLVDIRLSFRDFFCTYVSCAFEINFFKMKFLVRTISHLIFLGINVTFSFSLKCQLPSLKCTHFMDMLRGKLLSMCLPKISCQGTSSIYILQYEAGQGGANTATESVDLIAEKKIDNASTSFAA